MTDRLDRIAAALERIADHLETPAQPEPMLLDIRAAATALGVPETWLRANARSLHHTKVGRRVYFSRQQLEQAAQDHAVPASPAAPDGGGIRRRPTRRRGGVHGPPL